GDPRAALAPSSRKKTFHCRGRRAPSRPRPAHIVVAPGAGTVSRPYSDFSRRAPRSAAERRDAFPCRFEDGDLLTDEARLLTACFGRSWSRLLAVAADAVAAAALGR